MVVRAPLRPYLFDTLVQTIITLTTDFGTRDAYVAAVKGTILQLQPAVRLVDITHEITPQDIMEAAFVLRQAVPFFPPDTIHVVVVDPGVGTTRRPLALRHGGHVFVGPDNGIFPLLLDNAAPDEVVELNRPAFWRTPEASPTFHGRDLFAPVAAHLASGRALGEVGTPVGELKPLRWALPIADPEGIRGWVVHVDHFGNCITNIPQRFFEGHHAGRVLKCFAGNAILHEVYPTYAAVEPGEPLLLFGSTGFLEIAVNTGNASQLLDIGKGTPVNIVFLDKRVG